MARTISIDSPVENRQGLGPMNEPIRKDGILMPANNSFEAINNFVHNTESPSYEELQWALLGIAAQMDRLTTGGTPND